MGRCGARCDLLPAILCVVASSGFPAQARRTNVVFILVDDQGCYDLGCYGATEFVTPRIDAVATPGVRLTQEHFCCAPPLNQTKEKGPKA
jgi:arylsulfatase A